MTGALLDLGVAAKAAVSTLAMMAVYGTLLAMIAFVVVRGGRLRPALQAAVWLVVLAKFVLPWSPSLPWSLADVIATLRGGGGGDAAIILVPGPAPVTAADAPLAPALGWLLLSLVWFAGTAFVVTRALRAYRNTLASARRALPAPPAAQALLRSLAATVRVRAPRLVVGDAAVGPHVVGAVRPIIVVPPALVDSLEVDPALLRAALLHELAHVRRRDALGRFVQLVARAMFWFFPIVRMASKRLELAREAACDAWALEAGDVSRPAYARLLLHMSQLRTVAAPALAAPHTLDARVAAVLGPPVRPRLGWIHRLALIGWIAVALGGARTAAARGERPTCLYTPDVAEALYQAYPSADVDGDGSLSREEACDFQAELRKRVSEGENAFALDVASGVATKLLAQPLCCNCDPAEGLSTSPSPGTSPATCQRVEEGVDR